MLMRLLVNQGFGLLHILVSNSQVFGSVRLDAYYNFWLARLRIN
jgi:hypothetical protein